MCQLKTEHDGILTMDGFCNLEWDDGTITKTRAKTKKPAENVIEFDF